MHSTNIYQSMHMSVNLSMMLASMLIWFLNTAKADDLHPCHYGPEAVMKATVTLRPFAKEYKHDHEDKLFGTIMFYQKYDDPVKVEGSIKGLPHGYHGIHIHEFGDVSQGCVTTGSHFNPFKKSHGDPQSPYRHAGDLGNIFADYTGTAHFSFVDSLLSLNGPTSIIGRSVVVHAYRDDLGLLGYGESLSTGNAGPRLGCGVIGIAYETKQYPCPPEYEQEKNYDDHGPPPPPEPFYGPKKPDVPYEFKKDGPTHFEEHDEYHHESGHGYEEESSYEYDSYDTPGGYGNDAHPGFAGKHKKKQAKHKRTHRKGRVAVVNELNNSKRLPPRSRPLLGSHSTSRKVPHPRRASSTPTTPTRRPNRTKFTTRPSPKRSTTTQRATFHNRRTTPTAMVRDPKFILRELNKRRKIKEMKNRAAFRAASARKLENRKFRKSGGSLERASTASTARATSKPSTTSPKGTLERLASKYVAARKQRLLAILRQQQKEESRDKNLVERS